MKGISFLCGLD